MIMNSMEKTREFLRSIGCQVEYFDKPAGYEITGTEHVEALRFEGKEIPVELRQEEEIRSRWYREPMAPAEVKCYNPSFDVTEHDLIAGIITEKGICRPPYTESLRALFE